ncbi:MAG: glycosyltransferase [Marinilabiliaceae bacterium]|nr:glycosyltransferase [Marinilabiliaceae bacterium]
MNKHCATSIVFLSSAHGSYDDRIFFHLADTLKDKHLIIISSKKEEFCCKNGIQIDSFDGEMISRRNKIKYFETKLIKYSPKVIICSEPLPIIAAWNYKRKHSVDTFIIYDITEWYPSKKHVERLSRMVGILKAIGLFCFDKYACCLVDGFIFGEYAKRLPYRFLFPFKKWVQVSYYPDLKYINYRSPEFINSGFILGYTGRISEEKGIGHFFDVFKSLAIKYPNHQFTAKIIGKFLTSQDRMFYCNKVEEVEALDNVKIVYSEYVSFLEFSDSINDVDILFDLRVNDFENNRCLPIKLFFYLACGKPIVYTNLRSIYREIDLSECGLLSDPTDILKIISFVESILFDRTKYKQYSLKARELAIMKYNWSALSAIFTQFINRFLNNAN